MSHKIVLQRFEEKFAPRRYVLVERFNFNELSRGSGELTIDFLGRLKASEGREFVRNRRFPFPTKEQYQHHNSVLNTAAGALS